jgi:uncharacterized coiled-coil DUF342 family protein
MSEKKRVELEGELSELRVRRDELNSLVRETLDKRNTLNSEVSKQIQEIKELKSKRDASNAKVQELKSKRDDLEPGPFGGLSQGEAGMASNSMRRFHEAHDEVLSEASKGSVFHEQMMEISKAVNKKKAEANHMHERYLEMKEKANSIHAQYIKKLAE